MRKLLLSFAICALGAISSMGAIVYYDDYPRNPTPPDTYILSMQTGDKSVGGVPYNFWTLGDMTSWLQSVGFTNGSSDINIITNNSFIYSTNIVVESITNTTFVNTNITILTSNAFFNNVYETNVTIVVPGGVTNLNLTPNSLMQSDANDAESSVPNGTGILTNNGAGAFGWTTSAALTGNFIENNNGNGTNTTLWGTTIFDELDVDNAYLTNLFILVTNAPLLSTDGNGQVVATSGLRATNVSYSPGANMSFTTNVDGSVTIASSAVATNTTSIVENFYANYITNNLAYITNLFSTNIISTNLISGKVTVNNFYALGAAVDNLTVTNAITNKLMSAIGVVTNDANGKLYTTPLVDPALLNLIRATNNDTVVSNSIVARTITVAGTANQITSSAGAQDLTANRTWTLSTPSPFIAPGVVSATGLTNSGFAAIGVVTNDANGKLYTTTLIDPALLNLIRATNNDAAVTNEVTRQINSSTNIYASLGTAISDLSLGTNLTYKYTTNIVGAANFVFGKAYWTNATANFTFPALTMQDSAAMETMVIMVTNSSGSTITATINGVSGGPAHAIPSVFYCTNAAVTEIDVKHFGVLWTNAMSQ